MVCPPPLTERNHRLRLSRASIVYILCCALNWLNFRVKGMEHDFEVVFIAVIRVPADGRDNECRL